MEKKWYQLVKVWAGQPIGKQIEMTVEDGQALVDTGWAKEVTVDVNADMVKATLDHYTKSVSAVLDAATDNMLKRINTPKHITVGDAEEDKTKCFADFLRRVGKADHAGLNSVYKATKSAMGEASGTTGGYLVPPEYLDRLMQVAAEDAIVRPRAEVIPMSSRTIEFPMLDQTTVQSTGTTPFFGGIVARWTGESKARNETEPAFKQVELVAHELAGLSYVSRVLMADSIVSVDKMLTTNIAKAIGWYEDYGFLQGDGLAKPKGVLNSPATIGVTRTGSSTSLPLADIAKIYSKLLPGSVKSAVWVMSQTVLPLLIQLSDTSGRVIYLPNPTYNTDGGSVTKAVPMTLLGIPVMFTEKLPAAGTAGDVMLCDFSKYIIADRRAIEIESSDQYAFNTNQIVWRFLHRVDGQAWLDAPITYQDGSTQVSPFVKLV